MTQDELQKLEAQRERANELAHSDLTGKREAYKRIVADLDAEILVGRQQVRQQGIEDAVKARLRLGFAGPDSDFEKLWLANKDKLMLEQMTATAAQAEAESLAALHRPVAG